MPAGPKRSCLKGKKLYAPEVGSKKDWNTRFESYLEPAGGNFVSKRAQVQEEVTGEQKGPMWGALNPPHTEELIC